MSLIAYMALGGPFLVVLLDLIIARDAEPRRRWFGIALALLGMVIVPLRMADFGAYPLWLFLLPGIILLTHSGRMSGLGQFIVFFGWLELCGLAIGSLASSMRIGELAYLPVNVAFWVIPVLLLWHLWSVLPLVYDTIRGGIWAGSGVPLSARYSFLVVIVIVSVIANAFLYWQWTDYREMLRRQEGEALLGMRYELKMVDHWLAMRGEQGLLDWAPRITSQLENYGREVSDLKLSLRINGIATVSPLYFLTRTLPGGVAQAVERGDELSEADVTSLQAAIRASVEAIEAAIEDRRPLSSDTYRKIVDQILAELEGTDALQLFDVQYKT